VLAFSQSPRSSRIESKLNQEPPLHKEDTMTDFHTPLRVAQIGVMNFGRRRRNTLRETGLFELLAIHDWNAEALATAAVEEGCPACASYEELLDTPGLEAVIISTGAMFHADQIEQAAERGLHVFVEKPVCATPTEVRRLLDLEKRTGVVIAVGHCAHDKSAVSLTIKRLIDSGALGTLATFQKTTAHNGGFAIQPGDWRGDAEKNPGGMLFQCGVHGLHELMFYFGPVREVYATMRHDVHTTQTADIALCQLRFDSGLVGTLSAFHVTPYKHNLMIYGTEANLYRDDRFFDEGVILQMQRGRFDGGKEVLESVEVDKSTDDPFGNLRNFFHAIREGKRVYPSLADGLKAVQIVFAAQESARLGRAVPVSRLSDFAASPTDAAGELSLA
jgi:predicted dehydrogenase